MSDKLALSAAFSVLMMTVYALFGSEAARAPFGPAGLDAPAHVAVLPLPSFDVAFAKVKARPILY